MVNFGGFAADVPLPVSQGREGRVNLILSAKKSMGTTDLKAVMQVPRRC